MAKRKKTSRSRAPKSDLVDLGPIRPIIERAMRTSRDVSEAERLKVNARLNPKKD